MAGLHLLRELKRRNVFRAAVLYVGAVWAFGQGLSQFSPAIGLPDGATRWFLIAAIIGFPFWIALAWFYEFTPGGIKRESEIDPADSIAHSTGRKLNYWIFGVMAVAIVLLLTNQLMMHRAAHQAAAVPAVAVPEKSVAVLPLANESGDPRQQYFSDGLSEELITDLTQVDGLKVIGKYSSFQFRDSRDSPAKIGAALGVANLIQGSVFQQADRIRVNVSLIRTKDGSSVWAHSYEGQLADVFAIQSQIGHAVAAALKIKLLGRDIVSDDKPPSGNVEAYRLMLQGRALNRHGTEADIHEGIALLDQAIRLDPGYAYAWGTLSNAWINLGSGFLDGDARLHAYAQARAAADKQQTFAPDAAYTHMDRGYLLTTVDGDATGALAEYQRAFALAPNDETVINNLAGGLATVGQSQRAIELYRKAIAIDPLRASFYVNLGYTLLGQRQLDAAEQAFNKTLAAQPDFPGLHAYLAQIAILRGDAATALNDAKQEANPLLGPWAVALAKQIGPDRKQADAALQDYVARNGKNQPYLVADLYALRKQPDLMFEWLERASKQHDPNLVANLLSDPFVLAYQHDPRFAALCHKVGLPVATR